MHIEGAAPTMNVRNMYIIYLHSTVCEKGVQNLFSQSAPGYVENHVLSSVLSVLYTCGAYVMAAVRSHQMLVSLKTNTSHWFSSHATFPLLFYLKYFNKYSQQQVDHHCRFCPSPALPHIPCLQVPSHRPPRSGCQCRRTQWKPFHCSHQSRLRWASNQAEWLKKVAPARGDTLEEVTTQLFKLDWSKEIFKIFLGHSQLKLSQYSKGTSCHQYYSAAISM